MLYKPREILGCRSIIYEYDVCLYLTYFNVSQINKGVYIIYKIPNGQVRISDIIG